MWKFKSHTDPGKERMEEKERDVGRRGEGDKWEMKGERVEEREGEVSCW